MEGVPELLTTYYLNSVIPIHLIEIASNDLESFKAGVYFNLPPIEEPKQHTLSSSSLIGAIIDAMPTIKITSK